MLHQLLNHLLNDMRPRKSLPLYEYLSSSVDDCTDNSTKYFNTWIILCSHGIKMKNFSNQLSQFRTMGGWFNLNFFLLFFSVLILIFPTTTNSHLNHLLQKKYTLIDQPTVNISMLYSFNYFTLSQIN